MKKFNYEEQVIDVILNLIKDNQKYLTKKENLPQLAKLGYMYNTLWYAGRLCWGSSGLIQKGDHCEDNPKYKIEMCDPLNEKIENLIYDAWGMHVMDMDEPISWKEFLQTVVHGKVLSAFDKKMLKENKTFDEWVEVLTDPEYRYQYDSRREVANHLLCTIGNGYGYKDGFIIREASGADQDLSIYGAWQNANLRDDIKTVVFKILAMPEVEQTLEQNYAFHKKLSEEKKAKDLERDMKIFGMPYKEFIKSPEKKSMLSKLFGEKEKDYHSYYPISSPYSEITKFDKNTDPSYIKAGLEICDDILAHEAEELKEGRENVAFAKKFIKKFRP